MKFKYFRLSLIPVQNPELEFKEKRKDRLDILQEAFAKDKKREFNSGVAKHVLVIKINQDNRVYGRIGKQASQVLHESPEKGFAEKIEEDWPYSHIFINLSDEKDTGRTIEQGQIIALHVNQSAISNPLNCLRALSEAINKTIKSYGFYMSISPIIEEKDFFWAIVKKYHGQIEKIELTYIPPNILSLQTTLEEDLKEANKTFNTTRTKITLENQEGNLAVPENNMLLKESVAYMDAGGGSFTLKIKDVKKIIKSENSIKETSIEAINIEASNIKKLEEVFKKIFDN